MRKLAFLIIIGFAVVTSCERSFDISRQKEASTMWMSFIPSNDYDTTFFYLQATTPLGGPTSPVLTLDETIDVQVNGQPVTLCKSSRSIKDRLQTYYTDRQFSSGDRITAAATVPDVGSINAECLVPESFPDFVWTAKLVALSKFNHKLLVDIEYDAQGSADYYGVRVVQLEEIDSQEELYDNETGEKYLSELHHSSNIKDLVPIPLSESDYPSPQSEEPVCISPAYFNYLDGSKYSEVQIWRDVPGSTQSDGSKHMIIASKCNILPARTEYSSMGLDSWTEYRYKYKLILYRFSDSCYNYLKARYNSSHSDFTSIGLTPASFVYTNVFGGSGICGAYTVSSSDWIEIEPDTSDSRP